MNRCPFRSLFPTAKASSRIDRAAEATARYDRPALEPGSATPPRSRTAAGVGRLERMGIGVVAVGARLRIRLGDAGSRPRHPAPRDGTPGRLLVRTGNRPTRGHLDQPGLLRRAVSERRPPVFQRSRSLRRRFAVSTSEYRSDDDGGRRPSRPGCCPRPTPRSCARGNNRLPTWRRDPSCVRTSTPWVSTPVAPSTRACSLAGPGPRACSARRGFASSRSDSRYWRWWR